VNDQSAGNSSTSPGAHPPERAPSGDGPSVLPAAARLWRRLRLWLLLGYTLALVAATHWPQLVIEAGPIPRPDLFAHFAAFGVFAFLLNAAALFGPLGSPRTAFRVLLIALPWCVIDEATQSFEALGRFVTFDDLLANWGGVVIGSAAALALGPVVRRSAPPSTHDATPDATPGAPPDAPTPHAPDLAAPGATPQAAAAASVHHRSKGFVAHARTFAGVTMISRVFGLARDALCAFVFGAGPVWSAFVTAFIVPNVLRRLFGEGALSAAFIPRYTKLVENDRDLARRLAVVTILGVGAVVALFAALALLVIVALLRADLGGPGAELVLTLAAVMLPFMPAVCMTAVLTGVLQAHGRFAPGAATPILLNAWMISGVCIGHFILDRDPATTALWLAGAVATAGVVQTAWAALEVGGLLPWRASLSGLRRRSRELRLELRGMLARMAPMALGLGATQLGLLIDGLIAGWPVVVGATIAGLDYPLDQSSAAVLYFGQRLYQLPIGVFAVAVATALLPALSRVAADSHAFRDVLSRGVRTSAFVAAPAAVGLAAVALPLVWTIYGGRAVQPTGLENEFTADDARRVTTVLAAYAPAVLFAAIAHAFTRAFYAQEDARGPMLVGLATVAANVALNLVLIWFVGEIGLAISTSVCAFAQAVALGVLARRRLPGLRDAALAKGAWRSVAASLALALVMGAAVLAVVAFATDPLTAAVDAAFPDGWPVDRLAAAALLTAAVALGAALYLAASALMKRPELAWALRRAD